MRLQDVVALAKAQGKLHMVQFIHAMHRKGLKLQRYRRGLSWWPVVVCNHPRDVLGATTVACEWEARGAQFLVYPAEGFHTLAIYDGRAP